MPERKSTDQSHPNPPGKPTREPRRSLEHSVRDGCAHAVMLGFGEAYLSAYAIFLGVGSLMLGVLATVPLLIGAAIQLGAVWLLDRARLRKPLVTGPAMVQATTWGLIFGLPFLAPSHAPALLFVASLTYFSLGAVVGPAWNSWLGDLVPPSIRGRFFGRREQLRMGYQLAALLIAGGILAGARHAGDEWLGFAVIFAIALVSRVVSVHHLRAMTEPVYERPRREHLFTLGDFLRRSPRSNFGRFTVYVGLVMAATNLAGPFFSLCMLRDLGFSYLQFTAASAAVLISQTITVRTWGRLGDRFGNRLLLQVTGLAVPFVPLVWLLSTSFVMVLVWQALAGVIWAGFNLSCLNFLFDAVSPPKRARCVAYYHLLFTAGSAAGAVLGGAILPWLPSAIALPGGGSWVLSQIQVLFLVSGLARLLLTAIFLPFIKEVRPVARIGPVLTRIAGLAAARGMSLVVFNGVFRDERREAEGESVEGDDDPPVEGRQTGAS